MKKTRGISHTRVALPGSKAIAPRAQAGCTRGQRSWDREQIIPSAPGFRANSAYAAIFTTLIPPLVGGGAPPEPSAGGESLIAFPAGGGAPPEPSATAVKVNDTSNNANARTRFMLSPYRRGVPQANSVVGNASRGAFWISVRVKNRAEGNKPAVFLSEEIYGDEPIPIKSGSPGITHYINIKTTT
jgi:hypothetical protein